MQQVQKQSRCPHSQQLGAEGTTVRVVITGVDSGPKYNQLHLDRNFKCTGKKITCNFFFSFYPVFVFLQICFDIKHELDLELYD